MHYDHSDFAAPLLASAPQPCAGANVIRHDLLQRRVNKILLEQLQDNDPTIALTLSVKFDLGACSHDWMSGNLSWTRPDGSIGQGPVIEFSVMDADLSDDGIATFVRTLIHVSDFTK